MELLDATIALAVTLAALATSVTVIMELGVRLFGLKSKGQIELFKRIYSQSFKRQFKGANSEFDFVTGILQNPLFVEPSTREKTGGLQKSVIDTPRRRDFFCRRSGVYDRVSTEHVFRQLLSLPGVLEDSSERLKHKLEKFNVEYNQLCAAASTSFKNNRHSWSVIIGIALALVLNVNVLRIFETFMANPALTAATVAQLDQLVEEYERDEPSLIAAIEKGGAGSIDEINQTMQLVNTKLSGLQSAGIPIGWRYSPHCHLPGLSCKTKNDSDETTPKNLLVGLGYGFTEIIACLITGLLIGLGAPFWFDVAKRLSQVRTMFGGRGGTADNYEGKTPIADRDDYESKTTDLIAKLVDEAVTGKQQLGARKLLTDSRAI